MRGCKDLFKMYDNEYQKPNKFEFNFIQGLN